MHYIHLVTMLGIDNNNRPYIDFKIFRAQGKDKGINLMRSKETGRYEVLNVTKTLLFSINRKKLTDKLINKYTDNCMELIYTLLDQMKNYHSLPDSHKELYTKLLGEDKLTINSNRLLLIDYLELLNSDELEQRAVFSRMSDSIIDYLENATNKKERGTV